MGLPAQRRSPRRAAILRSCVAWVTAISICVSAATSAAAPDYDQARQLYLKGKEHYRLTEFARALEAFTEAYRLVPQPALLYNIAQAHRELGNGEQALRFYRSFLASSPRSDPDRPAVEALVVELERASSVSELERVERARLAFERSLEEARRDRINAEVTLQRVGRPPGTWRGARALVWAGGATALAGLALVAGGTVPLVDASDARTALRDSAQMRLAFDPSLERRIDVGELRGGILLGVGGAVAIAGATMLTIGLVRRHAFIVRKENQ